MVFSAADFLLGLVPGLLWLAYFWKKDVWDPEPRMALLRVFALGWGAAWIVTLVRPRFELFVLPPDDGLWAHVLDAFVVTAAGEETIKVAAVILGALWHRHWDEPMDGIVYGAAVALGFASFENAVFLATTTDTSVLASRAFTANLAHVAFTAGFTLFLGLGWERDRLLSLTVPAFVVAVLVHGAYDLFLFALPGWSSVGLLVVLPIALIALALEIRWAHHASPFHPDADLGDEVSGPTSAEAGSRSERAA